MRLRPDSSGKMKMGAHKKVLGSSPYKNKNYNDVI